MKKPAETRPWFTDPFTGALMGVAALSAILYALLQNRFSTGVYNDDALCLVVARSFWGATPFKSLIPVRPDFPQPGLPLLLSPFAAWIGPHWTHIEWLSVAAAVGSVVCLCLWLRRWTSAKTALGIGLLYAFNPCVAKLSGILMPASYFTLTVIVSFWLLDKIMEQPTKRDAMILGFVVGWGSLLRGEAGLLAAVVVGALGLHPQGRKALRWAAIPLVFWLLVAGAWIHLRSGPHTEFGSDVAVLSRFWMSHPARALPFSGWLLEVFIIHGLAGVPFSSSRLNPLWSFPLIALGLAGIFRGYRALFRDRPDKRAVLRSVAVFCGLYAAVHLFWLSAVPRYGAPLIPFMLAFLIRGIYAGGDRKPMWAAIRRASIGGLGFIYIGVNAFAVAETFFIPDPMKAPPWHSLAWLKRTTPPGTKTLSMIAPDIELYANRPSSYAFETHSLEGFFYLLSKKNIDYIFDRRIRELSSGVAGTQRAAPTWRRVRIWAQNSPRYFKKVYANVRERAVIYEVLDCPTFIRAYEAFGRGARNFEIGRLGKSLQNVHEALRLDPDLGVAINLLGAIDSDRGHYLEAEKAFTRAAKLLPDSAIPLVNLATLRCLQGQRQRAEHLIAQAQEISVRMGNGATFFKNVEKLKQGWDRGQRVVFIHGP